MTTSTLRAQATLLADNHKAIVHLRAQLKRRRLGLIFGSGASKTLGFPDWTVLVDRIAGHSDIEGKSLLKRLLPSASNRNAPTRSLASITQILYGRFREKCAQKLRLSEPLTFLQEQKIKTDWIKIIHEALYRDIVAANRNKDIAKHPYLRAFLEIVKASPLTVNFNFDDTLEKMLLNSRQGEELNRTRGYEVVDRPNAQFQKDNSVIYHPNGYLPLNRPGFAGGSNS